MKALFMRKVLNLDELENLTKEAIKERNKGEKYQVIKEVSLNHKEFKEFIEDFFKEQSWISKNIGGYNEKEEVVCIRVIDAKTKKSILVNPEGYEYPRYVAIENYKKL